jgi:hypothetical protein
VRLRKSRLKTDRPLITDNGIIPVAKGSQEVAKIVVSVGHLWIQLDTVNEAGERFLKIPFSLPGAAEVDKRNGPVWGQSSRAFERGHRRIHLICCQQCFAEGCMRIGVVGTKRQRLPQQVESFIAFSLRNAGSTQKIERFHVSRVALQNLAIDGLRVRHPPFRIKPTGSMKKVRDRLKGSIGHHTPGESYAALLSAVS